MGLQHSHSLTTETRKARLTPGLSLFYFLTFDSLKGHKDHLCAWHPGGMFLTPFQINVHDAAIVAVERGGRTEALIKLIG